MTKFVDKTQYAPRILKKISIAALLSTCVMSNGWAESIVHEPALKILQDINNNPELVDSAEARDEALLTTGSIVKQKGKDRVLYHLPITEQGIRFSGETASKQWPVHIAREQLQGQVTLRLAYKNAVSVMPEASDIELRVNGVLVGKRPIQSPNRSATHSFDVPAHILVPGHNAVEVSTRQRHRVDCSINATHELWTEIDPARTGFVFERGNSVLNTLDGIAALARNKGGKVKMRLLVPGAREANQVSRSMLLAQRTAIYSDFNNPEVIVAGEQGRGPGLDIFTGSIAELRTIAPAYARAARRDQSLQILSRDGDERVALILLSNDNSNAMKSGSFAKALDSLFPKRTDRGSSQGIKAAHLLRAEPIKEGVRISFKELGLQTEEFSGRLYRREFRVNLPSDYFAADYDQAEIHLATAYTKDLAADNKFIIRVNGVTATGFAMGRRSGHIYKNKMLRLPLSSFRPGVNTVEIEARLAKEADSKCNPQAQIDDNKRFLISGDSTISFPRLAHLAQLPDLAGTVSAGFPYIVGGKPQPTILSVPNPGYGELSTAATFTTQIAVKSSVPLDFALQYTEPDPSVKNAIIVGAFNALPKALATGIKGINHTAFQTAWMPHAPKPNRNVAGLITPDGVDRISTAGISKQPAEFKVGEVRTEVQLPKQAIKIDENVMDRWSRGEKIEETQTDQADNDNIGVVEQARSLVSSVFGLGAKKTAKDQGIANPNSDILLSQRMAPSHDDGVWTILTGRNEHALRNGVALISKPAILNQISGETVTVNGVDHTVTSSISAQKFVQVRGFSLRNLHLIVAGWFSNNHMVYGALMIVGLLLGGLFSSRLLSSVGVQQHKEKSAQDA